MILLEHLDAGRSLVHGLELRHSPRKSEILGRHSAHASDVAIRTAAILLPLDVPRTRLRRGGQNVCLPLLCLLVHPIRCVPRRRVPVVDLGQPRLLVPSGWPPHPGLRHSRTFQQGILVPRLPVRLPVQRKKPKADCQRGDLLM